MPLDAAIQSLFAKMPQLASFEMWRMSPAQARAAFKQLSLFAAPEGVPIGKVEDKEAPGPGGPLKLRIYTPVAAGSEALPAIVYYHGGGFVLGDLECFDALCRTLANETGYRVIAVDYRLAPENPFPAAVEDSFAALKWVEANAASLGIDPNRVAVAGDSAGGNLAAVTTHIAAEKGGPHIGFQLLIYPALDALTNTPSAQQFGSGYFLDLLTIKWFRTHYVQEAEAHSDPRVSPLKARSLADLPPAYIVTAGFDPLRDDGAAYAAKLKDAGVPVTYVDYPTMIHGFFSMQGLVPLAREAVSAAAKAVKVTLG